MSTFDASDMDQAVLLSDATLSALELPLQPFGPLEANSASFSDEITAEQLADLKQALIDGDDLLLVLGEEGSGKSVMLKQLGDQSGRQIQCFAVKGSERFSTLNLFAGLLEAFKRPPPEQLQEILDESIPFLHSMVSKNTLSIVILDDAHKVSEGELTQLLSAMLYINSHDITSLRIAMAAPLEFENRIPDLLPSGADLPYSSLVIDGMTEYRAADFLNFRMQQGGFKGNAPFSEDEVAELVEESGGLPGPLQVAAAASLDTQYGPSPFDDHSTHDVETAGGSWMHSRLGKIFLGILAATLILLGLLMFLPSRPGNDTTRYTVSKTEPVLLDKGEIRLVDSGEKSIPSETKLETATPSPPATNVSITNVDPEIQVTSSEESPVEERSVSDAPTEDQEVAIENRDIVVVAEREPEDTETEQTSSEPTTAAAPIEEATPVREEVSEEPISGLLESPAWILLQDRERYTVQMSASRDRNSVVSFLNRNADVLNAPNSIYTFDRNGSTWYALLHGLFTSIDEARLAVETMPPSALTNQPWIRSVARIQDVLKAQ